MKHKEIVRAWLDGKIIQRKNDGCGWDDITHVDHTEFIPIAFSDTNTYRIRPKEPEKVLGTVYYKPSNGRESSSFRVIVHIKDEQVIGLSLPCAADLMMLSK